MSDSDSESEVEEKPIVPKSESDTESEAEEKPKISVKRGEKKAEAAGPSAAECSKLLQRINKTATTKHHRREEIKRLKKLKKKAKKNERERAVREAEALGEDAPPKKIPKTLESMREADETVVEETDPETLFDLLHDEFSAYFAKDYIPKILITSCDNPNLKTRLFLKELQRVIPNSEVFHRRQSTVKKMIAQSIEKGYTDIVVINEHNKDPCSMLVSHLPTGPTAFFRLSNVKLTKHIKRDWREITSHRPEIIMTNFGTRLGVVVGRMLASLFHYDPQFKGRRVVTFHNQRDYIFVRHHRYEFKDDGKRAALRELGPRFTLKLKSLQKGTFDSKTGEYEWIVTNRRHELESNRRRFHL